MQERDDDLERRVAKLEHEMQYARILAGIDLGEMGDVRERFDTLERSLAQTFQSELKAVHDGLVATIEDSAREMREDMATKADIATLAHRLESGFAEMRAEVSAQLAMVIRLLSAAQE